MSLATRLRCELSKLPGIDDLLDVDEPTKSAMINVAMYVAVHLSTSSGQIHFFALPLTELGNDRRIIDMLRSRSYVSERNSRYSPYKPIETQRAFGSTIVSIMPRGLNYLAGRRDIGERYNALAMSVPDHEFNALGVNLQKRLAEYTDATLHHMYETMESVHNQIIEQGLRREVA